MSHYHRTGFEALSEFILVHLQNPMIPKRLNDITASDIAELRTAGIQEGKRIDYKQELPGTRDEDKREFLADISSFANTDGGDIIHGVAEDQGVITDVPGISSPDLDAEILRLENLIRDGIAPRLSASFRIVPIPVGKLMIIRIEKSWIGPHRVIFRGHDKFYARNSAGKFALDVSQLRTAFLQSAALSEQISGFRLDRIIDISNYRTPVRLEKAPRLALHIIPLSAFSGEQQFDVAILRKNVTLHRPWSASGWDSRMTFDGVLVFQQVQQGAYVYSHFYRNGILESVTAGLLEGSHSAGRFIPHIAFEGGVMDYLPSCFRTLEQLGVHPPVSVSLSLIGTRGLRMALDAFRQGSGNEIQEENLIIPGMTVESFSEPPASILKPMFDRVWNACGLLRSENFDEQGNWAPRR